MSDKDILKELRERRIHAASVWDEIQAEAKKDRLCAAGNPWEALDPSGMKARKAAGRPYLALDELNQYLNQTINAERANPRGISFAPTGNGANDAGAEFYQNHTREIEYRSHAQMAYCTAFDNAVTASYGWLRITTKRAHVRTFDHDLWVEPIVNSDQVLPDPDAIWPDSRDVKFLFYIEPWQVTEFLRRFPHASIRNFSQEIRSLAGNWIDRDQINVAEYWSLESYTRKLIGYQVPAVMIPGQPPQPPTQGMVLEDELEDGKLPEGVENIREEEVDDTRVKAWITNGLELLEEIDWKGKYIPFVSCFGKALYVDDGGGSRRKLVSLTRLARDPYMLYCYLRTAEAEAVGASSRAVWSIYEGQAFKPDEIAKANKEPVPYVQWRLRTADTPPGQILPKGEKISWDPPLQNMEAMADAIKRAIQAAMGIMPLPNPMQEQNQKSGVALDKIQSSYQLGSFHFKDHFNLMIERTGVILEDLMDRYLDTARDVPVRLPNDDGSIVRVNDPRGSTPEAGGQYSGDPIFTKGDYRVTVSVGPSTDSQREEANDTVQTLASNMQVLAPIIGPQKVGSLLAKIVKLKQLGPIGDEIIELLEPPKPMGQDGKPIPPEMMQAQQQMKQMQDEIQKLQHVIETEQTKWDNQKQIEQMKLGGQHEKTVVDSNTKMAIAGLTERVDRMALELEHTRHARTLVHEAREGVKDRIHDVAVQHQQQSGELAARIHTHAHARRMAETQGAVRGALAARQAQPPTQPPPQEITP